MGIAPQTPARRSRLARAVADHVDHDIESLVPHGVFEILELIAIADDGFDAGGICGWPVGAVEDGDFRLGGEKTFDDAGAD